MPRNIPADMVTDLRSASGTMCFLLKFMPIGKAPFGLCSTNIDVPYDDGTGTGSDTGFITYRTATGFSPATTVSKSDLSVNNAEVNALIAQYPLDGVTMDAILRGEFDGCPFRQYLVNYKKLTTGRHIIVSGGTIGQISRIDNLACQIELRQLVQTLKQTSMVDLVSIGCRARFGDDHCKMPFVWNAAKVASVGAESDRTFNIVKPDGTTFSFADKYFEPGVAVWTSGDNEGFEIEVETFSAADQTVTLVFPTPTDIAVGDLLNVRRDCDKSREMCKAYNNIVNMRAEPDVPVGTGADAQAPTPSSA